MDGTTSSPFAWGISYLSFTNNCPLLYALHLPLWLWSWSTVVILSTSIFHFDLFTDALIYLIYLQPSIQPCSTGVVLLDVHEYWTCFFPLFFCPPEHKFMLFVSLAFLHHEFWSKSKPLSTLLTLLRSLTTSSYRLWTTFSFSHSILGYALSPPLHRLFIVFLCHSALHHPCISVIVTHSIYNSFLLLL